jgi:hypothetical protein
VEQATQRAGQHPAHGAGLERNQHDSHEHEVERDPAADQVTRKQHLQDHGADHEREDATEIHCLPSGDRPGPGQHHEHHFNVREIDRRDDHDFAGFSGALDLADVANQKPWGKSRPGPEVTTRSPTTICAALETKSMRSFPSA